MYVQRKEKNSHENEVYLLAVGYFRCYKSGEPDEPEVLNAQLRKRTKENLRK